MADEADVANKPAKAVKAEVYKANDAEANEADKAIGANEIKANVTNKAEAASQRCLASTTTSLSNSSTLSPKPLSTKFKPR